MYTVDIWMIDGKPGTGNTPIEKLLALIFSLWYLGSIIPVIWSYFNGSPQKLKIAISGPFLYHLFVGYNFFFYVGNFNVCNPLLTTPSLIAAFHAMLAIVCVASIDKKSLYTYNRYVKWRQNKIKDNNKVSFKL